MKQFSLKSDYTTYSQGAIRVLVDRGFSLTEIAKMLGVSKSYISRVKMGSRSFTLDHLERLQEKCGEQIPLLILESVPRKSIAAKNLPLFDAAMKLARNWYASPEWNSEAKRSPKRSKSSRRKVAAA